MYQPPQRIEYIDSLRGLAALAVLLGHSFIFAWPAAVMQWFNYPLVNLAMDGRAAVAMFFVLSGFVLARPYFVSGTGTPSRAIYLPTFYLRRLTRIWLPWLFVFGLSALAQVTIFQQWPQSPATNEWFQGFWQTPLTWMSFLRQCVFLEHNAHVQLLVQDWSLGVELKASALLPLFIILARNWSAWSLLPVSALFLALLPTGHYYVSFIMGVLLAQHGDPIVQWLKPKPLAVKASLLLAGLVFYQSNHLGGNLLTHPAGLKGCWLGTALGCALILLASLSSCRMQATLRLPALLFLGRISYSVYLLQFIVILCLMPPWICDLNKLGIYQTSWLLPLELIGSVGLTVGLSALTYRWVEIPCIDLGHWFSKAWQEKFLKP